MIERAIETIYGQNLTVIRRLLSAERAEFLIVQARLEEAEGWAREYRVGEVADSGLTGEREWLSLVRLRLARGEAAEAVSLLTRLLGPAKAAERFGVVIEILALQSLALQASGDLTPALSALERALVLAEPEGYLRTFADHGEPMAMLLRQVAARRGESIYVARLFEAIQGLEVRDKGVAMERDSSPPPASCLLSLGIEPLTPREVEVLRLLAAGASNQRIAEALTVSVGTVKAHISHILGKIRASNRTEAAARARELGLLHRE